MKKIGLGQRLIARIQAKGYTDASAKFGIRVTDFALDHRYPPGSLYKWIGELVVPDYDTILRLAKDLETNPGWLHYGTGPVLAEPSTPPPPRPAARQGPARRALRATGLALALAFTLYVQEGAGWTPVARFSTEDACIDASWRVGLLTGRLAECRPTYRL